MSWFSEPKRVICRKRCVCAWCGTYIQPGEKKASYFYRMDGDHGNVKMHSGCYDAMGREDPEILRDGLMLGEYSRGCTCENGDCRCLFGG